MDQNMNYNQNQPYNMGQNGYMAPPSMTGGQPPKKSKVPKFLLGILTGIFGSAFAVIVVANVYTSFTGNKIVIGGNHVNSIEDTEVIDDKTAQKVDEVYSYLSVYYYEEIDEEVLKTGLYKGLAEALGDPYTTYYTRTEYEELKEDQTGEFCGIGAGLTQDIKTMEVTITTVYPNTPAEEAGLKKGDVILSVNDINATEVELEKLVQDIRGEEGTSVTLTIYREAEEEEMEFEIVRRPVEIASVTSEMLENKIGYIQITEFQTKTAEQFETALLELQANGMQKLIVDLRGNPGGLVDSVVDILDIILPKGTIVYTEDKYGFQQVFKSDAACIDIPIVVLTDGNSASASEIFAGAIRDYNYGTIIGTTTYGKGIVQTIFPLKDGDAIKITTSRYYTPSGVCIHGVGIEPDIELEYEYLGPEEGEYEKKYDNQIQRAIEELQ